MDRRIFFVNPLAQSAVALRPTTTHWAECGRARRRDAASSASSVQRNSPVVISVSARPKAVAPCAHRGEKIIAAGIERFIGGHRARRNDPHDFAFDHALGQGRVFHLFADRDFMAGFEEFLNVGLAPNGTVRRRTAPSCRRSCCARLARCRESSTPYARLRKTFRRNRRAEKTRWRR